MHGAVHPLGENAARPLGMRWRTLTWWRRAMRMVVGRVKRHPDKLHR
jgi:hypothetical protein